MKAMPSSLRPFLIGAGVMYLFDPVRGRRRRARIRDQLVRSLNAADDLVAKARRDFKHRAYGLTATARSRLHRHEVPDHVLEERVRAEIGRFVSHPHAVHVSAREGRVRLAGPVLSNEAQRLVGRVARVAGVRAVVDDLEVHTTAEGVPALQGGRPRPGRRPDFLQENWSPATRIIAVALGTGIALNGVLRGGLSGRALSIAGAGLAMRGIANLPFDRLIGLDAGRRAVEVQKMINVNAPVDEVFRFWAHFENFPAFMAHLDEVHWSGDTTSHWVATGPGGIKVEWDAEVTEFEPNRLIAWKSTSASAVKSAGRIRFVPTPDGGTRVDVHMAYNPPGGAIGHALATLLGADPKHAMDEDLVRFKSLIEEGKASRPGSTVYRDEIERSWNGESLRP